jgi:hypothetical protein
LGQGRGITFPRSTRQRDDRESYRASKAKGQLQGIPASSDLIFEALLNATSMFSHGDLRLRAPIGRALRLLRVTPEMHRIHHFGNRVRNE